MLYVTTREKYDAFTTARTLASSTGADGGRYLPYRMPVFTSAELDALSDQSFGQTVANVLNLFFGCRLTGWDIEFSIGRFPVKLVAVGQRILSAECWRNLEGSYDRLELLLAAQVNRCDVSSVNRTSWLRVAVRIAVLTAIFGEIRRAGFFETMDIAVADGDFILPMAAWYGREMGLPIANIVIGCGDGSDAWDLLHNGHLRSCGEPELERLVFSTLGMDAVRSMADGYALNLQPDQLQILRRGIYQAVVSEERRNAVIPNVYGTNTYILDPGAAVAYSALMDYRARTGETRGALILEDVDPSDTACVARMLGMTSEQLKERLN